MPKHAEIEFNKTAEGKLEWRCVICGEKGEIELDRVIDHSHESEVSEPRRTRKNGS